MPKSRSLNTYLARVRKAIAAQGADPLDALEEYRVISKLSYMNATRAADTIIASRNTEIWTFATGQLSLLDMSLMAV